MGNQEKKPITNYRLRRDLSGISIFDTLAQDNGKRKPTCIEDCRFETANKWLNSLDIAELNKIAQSLNKTFSRLLKSVSKSEAIRIINNYGSMPYCWLDKDKVKQISNIQLFCTYLRHTAITYNVYAPNSEVDLLMREERKN